MVLSGDAPGDLCLPSAELGASCSLMGQDRLATWPIHQTRSRSGPVGILDELDRNPSRSRRDGSTVFASPGGHVADDEDDKSRTPIEQYKDVELGGLPPIAPDGGFAPGPVGMPPGVDAATPANFMCLRGPCRHYWQIETFMASGNPKETWGPDGLKDPDTGLPLRVPRQISRSCVANPGHETELTEDCVYDCNRWDPLSPREVRGRDKRAAKYLKLHPEHRGK